MTPTPDLQQTIESLKLFIAVAGAISIIATAASVWAVTQTTVKRLVGEVLTVKQVTGLEPVDGRIRAAFPTHDECKLREDRSDRRLAEAELKLDDHERRLTAVEVRQEG